MSIIVKISCGLGNQMFQYSFGRYLSLKNKTDLKLDITEYNTDRLRVYELNKFCIQENFAKKAEISLYSIRNINQIKNSFIKYVVSILLNFIIYKILIHFISGYVQEKSMAFVDKYLKIKDGSYVSGYWQSEKYFVEIRDILLKDFMLKEPIDKKNEAIINEMQNCNSVAIHFRRGDYVTQKFLFKPNIIPCDLDYYYKAIEYIEKKVDNPVYFIFSDDSERVKENFNTDKKCIFIDWNKGNQSFKDMILMSKCKHNIIANSSFSWWGAWLNTHREKIVIGPKKWFNKEHLNKQAKNLIPDHWVKM